MSPRAKKPAAPAGHDRRIAAFDGWRLVAVSLVIMAHVVNFSALAPLVPVPLRVLGDFAELGVHIFFVISGFVICLVLQRELAEQRRISVVAFYVRRVFRILPPLAIYLAAILALGRSGAIDAPPLDVAKAALFACNLPGVECGWYVQHTWSLGFEEQFYIVFPFLFALTGIRWKRLFLFALVAVFPLAILAASAAGDGATVFLLGNFQYILCGVVFSLHAPEIERWLRAKRFNGTIVYVCIVAIVGLDYAGRRLIPLLIPLFAVGPLTALALLHTSSLESAVRRVLSLAPVRLGGRISYTLYLWQQLATGYVPHAGIAFYAASLAGIVVLALASWRFVEQPLIRYGAALSGAIIIRGRKAARRQASGAP